MRTRGTDRRRACGALGVEGEHELAVHGLAVGAGAQVHVLDHCGRSASHGRGTCARARRTVSAIGEVEDVAEADVEAAERALVKALKFAVVEELDRQARGGVHSAR